MKYKHTKNNFHELDATNIMENLYVLVSSSNIEKVQTG